MFQTILLANDENKNEQIHSVDSTIAIRVYLLYLSRTLTLTTLA